MNTTMDMTQLTEILPFLLPLVIAELALLVYAIVHILTHPTYKRGSRWLWMIVVIADMEFIGPLAYIIFGKEEQ